VRAGARQVECTITASGERAACSLNEDNCHGLKTAPMCCAYERELTQKLMAARRLLTAVTGFAVQRTRRLSAPMPLPMKAGWHQDGTA